MPEPTALSTLDQMFLWGERADTMMHVAGLLEFRPPAGASPTYLRDLVSEAISDGTVEPPWNRKLRHPSLLLSPVQAWETDENMDLEYHVRRDALPSPGSERELGVLVSRLHSHALDLRRPPWEMHIIEGLSDGRFAVYIKVHHALVDGYSAMRILRRSFSTDPEEQDRPLFFAQPPSRRERPREDSNLVAQAGSLIEDVRTHTSSALTLGRRVAAPVLRPRSYSELASGLKAPHSILNSRIGRTRRFATQQYDLAELKELGKDRGATLNDVVLTIIGGGLRTFLAELDQLPKKSLVAFLPVNVRPADDPGGGNAIGAILARVGSDIADPLERLRKVTASTTAAKSQLEGMTKQGILAYSAYLMAPTGLQAIGAVTGLGAGLPTNFNLCISNVPGPREDLYLRGSRLEASYPVSIPVHGMALNITVQSYVDKLGVGFVGCRDTLPHLQRLAVYTGEALEALRNA